MRLSIPAASFWGEEEDRGVTGGLASFHVITMGWGRARLYPQCWCRLPHKRGPRTGLHEAVNPRLPPMGPAVLDGDLLEVAVPPSVVSAQCDVPLTWKGQRAARTSLEPGNFVLHRVATEMSRSGPGGDTGTPPADGHSVGTQSKQRFSVRNERKRKA